MREERDEENVCTVVSIGRKALSNEKELTSVIIPNMVTEIGESAFEMCSGIKSISFPESVTTIGVNAFNGCAGLTEINYTAAGFGSYRSRSICLLQQC